MSQKNIGNKHPISISTSRKSKSLTQKTKKLLKTVEGISNVLKVMETASLASTASSLESSDGMKTSSKENIEPNDAVVSKTAEVVASGLNGVGSITKETVNPSEAKNQEQGNDQQPNLQDSAHSATGSGNKYHPLYVNGQNVESIFEMDHPDNPIFPPYVKPQPQANIPVKFQQTGNAFQNHEQKAVTVHSEEKKRLEHLEYENGLLRAQLKGTISLESSMIGSIASNRIDTIQTIAHANSKKPVTVQVPASSTVSEEAYYLLLQQNQTLQSQVKSLTQTNQILSTEKEQLRVLVESHSQKAVPFQHEHRLSTVANIELIQMIERHIQWVLDRRVTFNGTGAQATHQAFEKHTEAILAVLQTLHRLATASSGSFDQEDKSSVLDPITFQNMCIELSELLALSISEIYGNYSEFVELETYLEQIRVETTEVRKEAEKTVRKVSERYEEALKQLREAEARDERLNKEMQERRYREEKMEHMLKETERTNKALKREVEELKDALSAAKRRGEKSHQRHHHEIPLSVPQPTLPVVSLDQILDPNFVPKETLDSLQRDLTRALQEKTHLESHVTSLESTIEKWKRHNNDLQEKIAAQKGDFSSLNQTLHDTKRALQKAENKIEDKKLELKKLQEVIKGLKEGGPEGLKTSNSNTFDQFLHLLQSQVPKGSQQQQESPVSSDRVDLEAYIKLIKENEETSAQLKAFTLTMEEVTGRLKELTNENETLQSALSSTKDKLKARETVWIEKVKSLQESFNELNQQQENLNMVLVEYQTQYSDILSFISASPNTTLMAHPYSFTEVFAQVKASLTESEQQVDKLKTRLSEVQQHLTEKQEQLSAQSLSCNILNQELEVQKQQRVSLESKLQDTEHQVSKLQTSLETAKSEKLKLDKKLKRITEAYKVMTGFKS